MAGAPTCTTSDLRLESLIAAKAAELSGTEHCQFRLYDTLSDLDGDQLSDLVVVFTVEQAFVVRRTSSSWASLHGADETKVRRGWPYRRGPYCRLTRACR
jgi:hypothetical protein